MSRAGTGGDSSAIATLPNLISFTRILLIPAFSFLIVHEGTRAQGLLLFGAVVATDWVDGTLARRTGSVSELGKILDPTADRLAVAAGLISMVAAGLFPLWAALLILIRDGLILLAGAVVLSVRRVRLDVRYIGKAATFSLMLGVPWIAWGTLGEWGAHAALACGWVLFAVGIVESYVAAAAYALDMRRALAGSE